MKLLAAIGEDMEDWWEWTGMARRARQRCWLWRPCRLQSLKLQFVRSHTPSLSQRKVYFEKRFLRPRNSAVIQRSEEESLFPGEGETLKGRKQLTLNSDISIFISSLGLCRLFYGEGY